MAHPEEIALRGKGTKMANQPHGPFSKAVKAMNAAPRCGAKTRAGTPCRCPCVRGRPRCYRHGGAPGSGAPKGNKNAWKHGRYSRERVEARREAREAMRALKELLEAM